MSVIELDALDKDAWIEAEIQCQLDALSSEEADVEDDQEEDQKSEEDEISDNTKVPDSVALYLQKVQHRSEDMTKELQECEDLLKKTETDKTGTDEYEYFYESAELKELAFQLGEDPEELRERVMSELRADELYDAEQAEREVAKNQKEKQHRNEEDERSVIAADNYPVIALVSESDTFEQEACAKVRELEGRQNQMDHVRLEDRERVLKQQATLDRQMDEVRVQRLIELNAEHQRIVQERKVTEAKAKAILEEEVKQHEESLKKYQMEIEEFAKRMQKEKEELEWQLKAEKVKREKRLYKAAVIIQSTYRSYRSRKPYLKKLLHLREAREESRRHDRQMEIAEQRKQAEIKKKKERAEKKKREETERKKQEELKRKLEEEKKELVKKEKERKEKEQYEKQQLEAERLEAERLEQETQERERLEMEQKTEDILAKIAAENRHLKSASSTQAQGVEGDLQNISNNHAMTLQDMGHHSVKGHDLEVCSGDIGQIEERQKLEEGRTVYEERQLESESNKLDHPIIEDISIEQAIFISEVSDSNMTKNQLNTLGSNLTNESKTLLDNNENMQSRTSDLISDSCGHAKEAIQSRSHNRKALQECKLLTETEGRMQSSNAVCKNTRTSDLKDIQQNHIGQSSNQTSDTVINTAYVSTQNARPGPERTPSRDDPCLISGDLLQPLPEETEKLRLQWMKECTSLSKLLSDSKKDIGSSTQRRQIRRPRSARKLPALTEEQILAGLPENDTLDKVTTVHLEDLPGFNLSTLNKCPRLNCLTVHRCGLTALEGLDNSPSIILIDAQHNAVESVNCQDHCKLAILQLDHNHLSNLHGLEGCLNLRWLEIQHNKLTRISGLELVSSLTHVYASHNQLINTAGLQALVCLQRLDLSHNHLSTVIGIEKCCLLQRLNLSCNSLTKMPQVTNHVLLRELYLDDNSLSTLDVISDAWLPMLTTLSISQNSFPKLPVLHGCKQLKNLNGSHNFISDVDHLIPGLKTLQRLEKLFLIGNPVIEEQNCRATVLSTASSLTELDGDVLLSNREEKKQTLNQFEAVCLSQMLAQDDLQYTQQCDTQKLLENYSEDSLQLASLKCRHLEDLYKQAVEHRYMHEYGDMTVIRQTKTKTSMPSENIPSSGSKKGIELHFGNGDSQGLGLVSDTTLQRPVNSNSQQKQHKAATQIQALWHGYTVRRDIAQHTTYWLSAVTIQSAWRGHLARRKEVINSRGFIKTKEVHSNRALRQWGMYETVAATKIQATWRSYSVRKHLRHTRNIIKFEEEDDMFGEIDLSSFDYNEENAEMGWMPPTTPVMTPSYPVLPSTAFVLQHKPSPPMGDRPLSRQPRQAWRTADSPLLDHNKGMIGKPPLPPTSQYQDPRQSIGCLPLSLSSPPGGSETLLEDMSYSKQPISTSIKSSKTDKLSEEWGFKDSTTAELMMKRAKKLNQAVNNRKKKMLDPIKRYQMMKKTHDSMTSKVLQPTKKGIQRKDYFKAYEEEKERAIRENKEEQHERKHRTFEWVHSHVGNHDVSDSCINPYNLSGRQSNSEPNLPRFSPDVLQGGRIHLMASPILELQSLDGATSVASLTNRNRSNSFTSHSEVQLPPIKTNSAPSSHYRERMTAKQSVVTKVPLAWGGTPRSGGNSRR